MSNFASQSSLLNLAPKSDVKVVQASLNEGESGFLASLVQAIDESNGFLPQNLQITQKEIMQEFMQKTQKNSLLGDTEQKSSLFDSLSFVQVLGVLENLQIQNSEIKLANLSKPLQEFVQTQSNLDALKGAKNLDELLKIAKNLNLEVSNVKIDKIFELKTAFPNLDKANFFSTKLESAFKDFLNTKISKIIKENEAKFNHSKPKAENTTTLLSKLLQNVSKDGDDAPLLNNNELKNALQKSLEMINEGEELKLNKFTPKEPEKVLSSLKVLSENTQKDLNPKALNLKTDTPNITQATKATPLTDFKEPINFKELVKEIKPHLPKDENKPSQKLTQAVESKVNQEIQSKVILTTNELINQTNKELKKEVTKELNKEFNKEVTKEPKNSEKSSIKTLIDETMKELKSVESEKINKIPLNNDEKLPLKNQIKNDEKPVKAEFSPKNEPLQTLNAKSKKNSLENVDFAKQENKELKNQATKENVILANPQNQTESKIENKISTENKIKTSENLNLNQNITNKPIQTQRPHQNESNFIASDDKSELNSLIKDLSQVSRAELKSEVSVRETFTRFVQDLKEQIQHYKPPITRFNITLNPSNLGEVEVTLIQRGSNLHINFNSNTTAMNLFIQNQAEFKNSLVNMGFTGLEMNFSDQSKKDRQQQGKSRSGYGFKEELKISENSTLEMILARYF